MWQVKEPSLLKAISAKHRPVTDDGDSRRKAAKMLRRLQRNKQK
jgi:hypothetical protein